MKKIWRAMSRNWMAWVLMLSCIPALVVSLTRQDWMAVTGWTVAGVYAFLYGFQSRQMRNLIERTDDLLKANERLWRHRS
jgi:hypothetical protein